MCVSAFAVFGDFGAFLCFWRVCFCACVFFVCERLFFCVCVFVIMCLRACFYASFFLCVCIFMYAFFGGGVA